MPSFLLSSLEAAYNEFGHHFKYTSEDCHLAAIYGS